MTACVNVWVVFHKFIFVVVKRPYYPLLTGVVAHCLMIVPKHTNDSICMPLDWEYVEGAVITRRLR